MTQTITKKGGGLEPSSLTIKEKRELDLLFKRAMTHLRVRSLTAAIRFMSIERLEWTDSKLITTAAIVQLRGSRTPRIYINRLFLGELDRLSKDTGISKEKFLADVVAHELFHFMLRHLVSGEQRVENKRMANAIFDIFINHILSTLGLADFMREFYPSTPFEAIRQTKETPEGFVYSWSEEKDTFPTLFLNPQATKVHPEHVDAYQSIQGIRWSVRQIENYLKQHAPEGQDNILYIGSHGEGDLGEGEPIEADELSPEVRRELEEVVRDFFTKSKGNNLSHSRFGELFEEHLKVEREKDPEVDDVFLKAMIQDNKGYMLRNMGVYASDRNRQSVFPGFSDKRDLVLTAAGHNPVYFNHEVRVHKGRVVIYTDVSGSMEGIKELTYGLLVGLEEEYSVQMYVFSTELHPLSKHDLKAGVVNTTGGTDFNVWAEDMLENNYDKVLVITDGYGDISSENLEAMREKRSELYVVYTKDHMKEALEEFTKASCVLDSDRMYKR